MRSMGIDDRLGHLVPPGRLRRPALEAGLAASIEQMGRGRRTSPTRYVVAMHPADLAWLDPTLPDLLERSLSQRAPITIEFRSDPALEQGCPQFWAGIAGQDLLLLVTADVNAPSPVPAT
jgi:hypothetical protein